MKTGIEKLDEVINLDNSKLIVIASRPAIGKSTLALEIASNIALKQDVPTLFFSLETSREKLLELIAQKPHIAENDLNNAKLHFVDTPNLSINGIYDKCREMKEKFNIKAVFIDYIQLIGYDKEECLSRDNEISNISNTLKNIATELDINIFALSQLSRAPENRTDHRPILTDFVNNSSIVENADVIMFLYRDIANCDHKGMEIIIAKNTNGVLKTIDVSF